MEQLVSFLILIGVGVLLIACALKLRRRQTRLWRRPPRQAFPVVEPADGLDQAQPFLKSKRVPPAVQKPEAGAKASGFDASTYRWQPPASIGRDAFLGMFNRGSPAGGWGHDFATNEIKIRYPDMIFVLDDNGRLLRWECLEQSSL